MKMDFSDFALTSFFVGTSSELEKYIHKDSGKERKLLEILENKDKLFFLQMAEIALPLVVSTFDDSWRLYAFSFLCYFDNAFRAAPVGYQMLKGNLIRFKRHFNEWVGKKPYETYETPLKNPSYYPGFVGRMREL